MLMRLFRRGLPLCLFFVCLALSGCLERRLPEGVMASVNGEPIHLAAVQALMDSRSTSLGIPLRPSLEDMKNRYGGALGTLIVHTLVRQDLARRGLSVTDAALEHAVEQVRADFGPGGLEKFLTDSSLREADWKALMRDYLAMDVFRKRVLLPAIQVSLEEARAYYQEHKAEFLLPGSLDVCLATAPDREALTAYCGSFSRRAVADSRASRRANGASWPWRGVTGGMPSIWLRRIRSSRLSFLRKRNPPHSANGSRTVLPARRSWSLRNLGNRC